MGSSVKVKLSSIIEGIEFQGDGSQSYLNKLSGEVVIIYDEEMRMAESGDDISDQAAWYIEAVKRAIEYLENEDNYVALPSKYEMNEYRIMENFAFSLPIEEQRDEMLSLLKGKGAFSRFRQGLERFLLKEAWFKYRDEEIKIFAQDWCQLNDIQYEIVSDD